MTWTTIRSSSSAASSRLCPNERGRSGRVRPHPRRDAALRRPRRERVPRRVRPRPEPAGFRKPVRVPRHARLHHLGPRRDRPAVVRPRDVAGHVVLLGARDVDRDRPRAGDAVPPRPDISVPERLVPRTVGPGGHLCAVRLLGLPGQLDEPDHLRHVGERVRAERPRLVDVRVPRAEVRPARVPRPRLERGLNYLVLENGRSAAMGAFRDIVSATPGLCVTGLPPPHVAARFGLERTPILWITTASSTERTVRPNGLDFELVHTVVKFLRENPGTAVLLDDLDYLAAVAGFDAVGRFLKRVVNQASASKGTVIVAAGQGTFTPDQVAVLRGSVDRLLDIQEAPNPTPNGTADHVLMTINAQDASVALPLVGARRGLLLTTEHPSKARVRYGDRFDIVWVTDHPEPGTPTVRPKALDTEGRRAIANYASGHAGSDIVLVGLDQLALYVDVRSWLPFVKDALDIASLHECRLFLTVAPETMRSQELAMLSRRFDAPLGAAALKSALPSEPTTAAPESRIPYRGPSA